MSQGLPTSAARRRDVVAAYRRGGRIPKRYAAEVGAPHSTLAIGRQETDRSSRPRLVPVTVAEAPRAAALDVAVAGVAIREPAGFEKGRTRAGGYTPSP